MVTDLRADGRISGPEHEERMKAARRRAEWELGTDGWAGVIVAAYLDPDGDRERLAADMAAES